MQSTSLSCVDRVWSIGSHKAEQPAPEEAPSGHNRNSEALLATVNTVPTCRACPASSPSVLQSPFLTDSLADCHTSIRMKRADCMSTHDAGANGSRPARAKKPAPEGAVTDRASAPDSIGNHARVKCRLHRTPPQAWLGCPQELQAGVGGSDRGSC